MTDNKGKYIFNILLILFLFLYLFFSSNNNSIDAWGFAAYIKQGEQLFLPHHLLYNLLGFFWIKTIGLLGDFDTLILLKILNSVFATLCLFILGLILRSLKLEWKNIYLWVICVGSSWGLMRYAAENETYIIPIFFSLLGSYFFIKQNITSKTTHLFSAGLFSAVACLFHQVMFFWWIALLIGVIATRKFKSILWFILPAILVPISYILVLVFYYNTPLSVGNLMNFVLRDYFTGGAIINISFSSILLTAINLVRTFIQVHGYIFRLGSISLIVGLILTTSTVWGFIRISQVKWDWLKVKEPLVWIHINAIILQLLFAYLSNGNAEFMVMIPFLLVITFAQLIKNDLRFLGYMAAGMLIWNISVGLIPLHFYDLDNSKAISARIIKGEKNNENQLWILYNKPRIENEVKYFTGSYPSNIISGIKFDNPNQVKLKIDDALSKGDVVITDCVDRPKTISRENIVITAKKDLFTGYGITKIDSSETLSGRYFLYRLN